MPEVATTDHGDPVSLSSWIAPHAETMRGVPLFLGYVKLGGHCAKNKVEVATIGLRKERIPGRHTSLGRWPERVDGEEQVSLGGC